MTRRLPLLACLLAVIFSLLPSLALAAPANVPAGGPSRSYRAETSLPGPNGEFIAGTLTGSAVTMPGPDGQAVSGLTVRSGISDFFTVLCRQWDTTTGAEALQGSWFYGEASTAPGPDLARQAAGLARAVPMVGHACAVTQDPSPANIARLAFDVVTVVVFVQLVMHALPEISGVAVAMNHAPGALAAAQVLLQHGPGIIATVRAGMAVIDRLNAEGDQLQARLKQGAQARIESPADLQESVGPAVEPLSQLPGVAAPPAAADQASESGSIQALLPEALSGGRAAITSGAQWAGQNRQFAQGLGQAGQTAASAVAWAGTALSGVCVKLPFAHVGCKPAVVADAR